MLCVLYYALFCVLTIHNIIPQRFKHIGKLFVRLLQSKLLNARKKLNPIPCGILIHAGEGGGRAANSLGTWEPGSHEMYKLKRNVW